MTSSLTRSSSAISRGTNGLPTLTNSGHLPAGIHDATFDDVKERFVWAGRRKELWNGFITFIERLNPASSGFSYVYLDGGFVTNKAEPEDIDAILQPCFAWGPQALLLMAPFFEEGLDKIYSKYRIHLHFWCEGSPGGMSDFRLFFQYIRPQDAAPLGLKEEARKGIVRVAL